MKLEFAGFDLDGTLVNTLADLHDATNYALSRQGLEKITMEQTRRYVGNGVARLLQRACGGGEEGLLTALRKDFNIFYAAHCADQVFAYEGVPEAVAFLREHGVKTFVLTNKPDEFVRPILNACFPAGIFDLAWGQTERYPTKPDPASFFAAVKQLGLSAKRGVYIGDSEVDVQTAKNAKVPCIGCAWGFRPEADLAALQPDFLAKDGAALQKILESRL